MIQQQSSEQDYMFKVLILGNLGVGKTCILKRFQESQFPDDDGNTRVEFKHKVVQINEATVKMQIVFLSHNQWDTARLERFQPITASYYRGSHGILVVFDVSNRESFDEVHLWLKEVDKFAPQNVNKILVGNKIDLGQRMVSQQEAEDFATAHQITYFETSAKSQINIDTVFMTMARQMIERVGKQDQKQPQKEQNMDNSCVLI